MLLKCLNYNVCNCNIYKWSFIKCFGLQSHSFHICLGLILIVNFILRTISKSKIYLKLSYLQLFCNDAIMMMMIDMRTIFLSIMRSLHSTRPHTNYIHQPENIFANIFVPYLVRLY